MASLRTLYEKKQSNHRHSATQNRAEVTFTHAHAPAAVVSLLPHTHGALNHHLTLSLLRWFLVKICEKAAPTTVEAQHHSSSQQRLGQLKSRAKRSLTESLEGIWKVLKRSIYLVDPHQPFQKCPFYRADYVQGVKLRYSVVFICRVTRPEPRQTSAQEVAVVLPLIQQTAAKNNHVLMTLCLLPTAH